jgi:hypothetical protein
MWIRFCAVEGLLFGIEKAVDYNRLALSRGPSARARGFAIDDVWSAVYGDTLRITKDNFATIGNFLWIDSAIPFTQPRAVPSCIRA